MSPNDDRDKAAKGRVAKLLEDTPEMVSGEVLALLEDITTRRNKEVQYQEGLANKLHNDKVNLEELFRSEVDKRLKAENTLLLLLEQLEVLRIVRTHAVELSGNMVDLIHNALNTRPLVEPKETENERVGSDEQLGGEERPPRKEESGK